MTSDEKLGKTMLFPLAERMVVKFVNESKIEAEAGITYMCFPLINSRISV